MNTPFRRVVEPLKLGLAMAIIYAIAFYMGWEKVYWASVSAISVNLLSSGLTLRRGLMRVLGTAAGGFLGMFIIGMFPQERWAYLFAISIVFLILGYKLTGLKEPYFYLIILITAIVVMAVVQQKNYTDSGTAFEIIMLRVTQTWMGSVVMILIMTYVFPYRSVEEFEGWVKLMWGNHRKLYNSYRGMLFGAEPAEDLKHLRMEDAPLIDLIHFKLHGAEQDTFEMQEVSHHWHHFLHLAPEQYETLEALRQSLSEARDLDLTKYLTNLDEVCSELDLRFEQTDLMLGRDEPTRIPRHIAVELDEEATRALAPFQEAAVRVIKSQLEKLEEVSLSLFDCLARIMRFERPVGVHDDHHGHGAGGFVLAIDPFRLRTVMAFLTAVWIAFFVWLYIYDMPRASLYPCFVAITASIMAYRPEMNQLHYSAGWLVGAFLAFPVYIFIMQHLSGHLQLSVVIMAGVFLLQYTLWPHVHPIARIFTTIGFAIVIDAENHMHYSLQHYIQTILWMSCAIGTTLVGRFLWFPLRHDVLFMGMLRRFFHHANFKLSAQDAEGNPDRSLFRRVKSIFYRHSLLREAERLALYAGQLETRTGQTTYRRSRGATPEQMQEFVRAVYALGHRIEALVAAREAWHSNTVDTYVMDEKRQWHAVMQEWFRRPIGEAMLTGPSGDLAEQLARLETRIDEAFAQIGEGEVSTEEYENFYRRLGNYRGLSEAVGNYVQAASQLDWPRWQETRL